jgi:multimeric flavodoxin WrbA
MSYRHSSAENIMKKIVILLGSPRKNGNSERLAKSFATGSESQGAHVRFFRLHNMNIKGCSDCRQCWSSGKHCIVADDMSQLYESIDNADVIVFATPLYWYSWSAQIKAVWDRMLPYVSDKAKTTVKGKQGVLLVTAGDEREDVFDAVLESFDRSASLLGLKQAGKICAHNVYDIGDIEDGNWLDRAKELGASVGKVD